VIKFVLIFLAGIIAGFINVNAGGGSLLTMPALILLGLPSVVANGTNRIAILVGALSATTTFRKRGVFDWRFGLGLGIPALIGAIIGATFVIHVPDKVFNPMLSGVMILVLVIILINPRGKVLRDINNLSRKQKIIAAVTFFFVGLYGGFIQVGVGFIIIASLSLMTGLSLVTINALKVFVILIYTTFSLIVFTLNGKINLPIGLTLAAGSAIGAYLGTHFAVKKGDKWIRLLLIICVAAMAVKLSGMLDLILSLFGG